MFVENKLTTLHTSRFTKSTVNDLTNNGNFNAVAGHCSNSMIIFNKFICKMSLDDKSFYCLTVIFFVFIIFIIINYKYISEANFVNSKK